MASRRIVSLAALALVSLTIRSDSLHPHSSSSSSSSFFFVDAQQVSPPFPHGSIDVGGLYAGAGNPTALPGSHSGEGDAWKVSGSVGDIWSNSDKFHYLYSNRTGDVTVTCKVKDFTVGVSNWRKAGIMFRGSLGPQSRNSMIEVTGWGIAHQSRKVDGSYAESQHDSFSPLTNIWLRLVKTGNTVTSYVKKDGEYGYRRYHSVEVDLGPTFHVGLAVTMQDPYKLGTLDVTNFEISDVPYSIPGVPVMVGMTGNSNDYGNKIFMQEVAQGLWSISAAGSGIGPTADNLGLISQAHSGDVNATLRLESMVRRNQHTRGGVMMRATNAADSPHVSLLIDPNKGVTMYHRASRGGNTDSYNVGVMSEDVELRLSKIGDVVKCMYRQAGATEWFMLGEATAALGDTYIVGQVMASGESGQHSQLMTGDLIVDAPTDAPTNSPTLATDAPVTNATVE